MKRKTRSQGGAMPTFSQLMKSDKPKCGAGKGKTLKIPSGKRGFKKWLISKRDALSLEQRIAKIEAWIDFWEKYDSGWNKYRRRKR